MSVGESLYKENGTRFDRKGTSTVADMHLALPALLASMLEIMNIRLSNLKVLRVGDDVSITFVMHTIPYYNYNYSCQSSSTLRRCSCSSLHQRLSSASDLPHEPLGFFNFIAIHTQLLSQSLRHV